MSRMSWGKMRSRIATQAITTGWGMTILIVASCGQIWRRSDTELYRWSYDVIERHDLGHLISIEPHRSPFMFHVVHRS